MTPRTRSDDVEAALWSGWLLTGWPLGSAAVVVWLLRTLPPGGPHRVGLPVVALAAVGTALVVLALPVAARLLVTGLLWAAGELIARLRQDIPVVDSQPTTIPTTTADAATGAVSEPQQTSSRRTSAPDDGMSRTR